ncbi:MAG: HAD family hydrolase [Eubacteriales bacterium]|nr:HAD family hydrolase [Eubacteriales bacterium]
MNCFVFDIDGTLIDTAAVDQQAFHQALRENGYAFTPEQLRFSFGMPGREALRILGVDQIEAVVARWEALAYSRLPEVRVYDGVHETLGALRAAGKKCGIVTSRTRAQLAGGFSPIGLDHYFDTIVCADEVANPKPAPDELLECMRRLGCGAEETVYIGDSPYDMQCARSAGVKSALALWGCQEPETLEADCRLTHPSEILELR